MLGVMMRFTVSMVTFTFSMTVTRLMTNKTKMVKKPKKSFQFIDDVTQRV